MRKVKYLGLGIVVLITTAIMGFSSRVQATDHGATPRVLLVAKLSEANKAGDGCAEIIHLVRAAGDRGIAVKELDVSSKSKLFARYHVTTIPTVLLFDHKGDVMARYEGEGRKMIKRLRIALARLN